ncbi:hypothetical protein [Falsiroseomonas sp. CW058]|uniref:hypothetical protein n=1 Tax=Falsiroseomonas sp. CW058 TaxID=3388664 RepID=UPI003D3235E3
MSDALPRGGLAVAPPRMPSPGRDAAAQHIAALRVLSALASQDVASDALLVLADMADEASRTAWPWHRRDWRQLSAVLRDIAPAFAGVPLPANDRRAIPSVVLRRAAAALDAEGTAGAARLLARMAAAVEARGGRR